MTTKKLCLSSLFLIFMGLSMSVHAVSTTLTADGVIWTLTGDAIPGVSTTGSFTLSADATGWTGGDTAYLAEFSLKNFGSDVTVSNLTPTTWDWVNEGLNANGCKTNGTDDAICAFNDTGDFTNGPATGTVFSFSFDLTLDDVFPEYTHLKVRWLEEEEGYPDGKKVGSLISEDIGFVPEPGTLALLGAGLAGIGFSRRRKK